MHVCGCLVPLFTQTDVLVDRTLCLLYCDFLRAYFIWLLRTYTVQLDNGTAAADGSVAPVATGSRYGKVSGHDDDEESGVANRDRPEVPDFYASMRDRCT